MGDLAESCALRGAYEQEIPAVTEALLCSRRVANNGSVSTLVAESKDWRCMADAATSDYAKARPLGSRLDAKFAGYALPLPAAKRYFTETEAARIYSNTVSRSNDILASRYVYDTDASERGTTLCVSGGKRLFLSFEGDASLLAGEVLYVTLRLNHTEMKNQFNYFQYDVRQDLITYARTDASGEEASALEFSLYYGAVRHFKFELRDNAARLRFLTVLRASADSGDASTTRSALLVSRGKCPSLASYDVGTWTDDANQAEASLTGVTRSTEDAAAAAANLAAEPVQMLTVGYDIAEQGVYYLAVVGISPDEQTVELFGAMQCGLGYETTSFTNSCYPCPIGNFRDDEESVRCESCAQGSFAAALGTVNCTLCLPGSFLPPAQDTDAPALSCLLCEAGRAQPLFASIECDFCEDGTYNPEEGMAECFACPNNTKSSVGAIEAEECHCRATFYSPTSRTGMDCLECPVGANCEGGRIGPYSQSGYWQLATKRYQRVYPTCIYQAACLPGNTCADGYTGLLCARCAEGYYSRSSLCYQCPRLFGDNVSNEAAGLLLLLLTGLGFVCLALVLYALSGPDQLERTTSLFIAFNFLQLLNYFPLFRLGWPQFALDLFASLTIFNLNVELLSFECFFPSIGFFQRVLISFSLPFFMFATLGALLLLFSVGDFVRLLLQWMGCFRPREETIAKTASTASTASTATRLGGMPPHHSIRKSWDAREQKPAASWGELCSGLLSQRLNRFISAQLMFVNMCYIFLAYNVGSVLQCREVTPGKGLEPPLLVLNYYPEVECGSADQQGIAWLGIGALALYVIGFPLSMFIVISRGRKIGAFNNPAFMHRFGFFYIRFDDDYWYWEFVLMLRKLIVVYGAMFLNEYTLIQTGLAMVVLFISVIAQDYTRPYKNEVGDNLDFVLTMCLHFLLFDGLLFFAGEVTTPVAFVTNENYVLLRDLTVHLLFLIGVAGALTTAWYELRRYAREKTLSKVHQKGLQDESVSEIVDIAQQMLLPALVPKLLKFTEKSSNQERKAMLQVLKTLEQHYLDNIPETRTWAQALADFWTKLWRNLGFFVSLLVVLLKILTCQPAQPQNAGVKERDKAWDAKEKEARKSASRPKLLQKARERRLRRRLERLRAGESSEAQGDTDPSARGGGAGGRPQRLRSASLSASLSASRSMANMRDAIRRGATPSRTLTRAASAEPTRSGSVGRGMLRPATRGSRAASQAASTAASRGASTAASEAADESIGSWGAELTEQELILHLDTVALRVEGGQGEAAHSGGALRGQTPSRAANASAPWWSREPSSDRHRLPQN
mmetsp:Transcript_43921/g.101541  ORF Transcript_43921/g.101541 Transcript_43921/m.101541 type:complete len:1304 (-) Transcript_43921:114-4025(-)